MSTNRIYAAVIAAAAAASQLRPRARHLDIGAGRGELIRALQARAPLASFACDCHVERFAADVPCADLDLDAAPLPYADASFDLVTASEVVEHLENYRALCREMFRVTRPGGLAVITTPNVINLRSRVRYLVCGFANLFGPLPLRNERRHSTAGHITPIPYFYLAHALREAGFAAPEVGIDKVQKTSVALAALLLPFIALGWRRFVARERGRFRTLTDDNEALVAAHRSWPLLVGRTVVVAARKPAAGG